MRTVTVEQPLPMRACALGLPRAQPAVPIMVGGNGDRVLRVAATHATSSGSPAPRRHRAVQTHLSHFTWDALADRVSHVRRAAGARLPAPELSVLLQRVVRTADRDRAIAEFIGGGPVPRQVVADSPFVLMGTGDHLTEQLSRLRDDHGVTYVTTFEPSAAALAAVGRVR